MTDGSCPVEDKLTALRASYAAQLSDGVQELESAYRSVAAGSSEEDIRRGLACLCELAHKLSGSGAIFGFPRVSDRAYELELLAQTLLSAECLPSPAQMDELSALLNRLVSEAGSVSGSASKVE